jgi:phospholipid-binding lipoprotein MlaA
MRSILALALLALASGCASLGTQPNPADPWERFNRGSFAFNDAVDRNVLKPAARSYAEGMPPFAQEGVSNFFDNLQDLGTGANNLLQGKFADGASDLARFAVNTVVGIGGLWDVATPMGLEKHDEDFGQTLGWWGVPPGPYFVIPLLGPSTLRDAPARWVDPSYGYNRQITDVALRNFLFGLDILQTRAGLMKAEKILDEAALDRYSFTRDAWLQRRRHHVYDGRPPRDPADE